MSTLLTPIITQMELDRDRFTDLVNGDESVTINLESRTEKSIAGQVKDRIDAMSISLVDALNEASISKTEAAQSAIDANTAQSGAETAKNDAYNSQVATEAARDLTYTYRNDTETMYDDVNLKFPIITDARDRSEAAALAAENSENSANVSAIAAKNSADDAELYSNSAQDADTRASDTLVQVTNLRDEVFTIAGDTINDAAFVDLLKPPSKLYPTEGVLLDETKDTTFASSSPVVLSPDVTFEGRTITIQRYDAGLDMWVMFATNTAGTFSHTIPADSFDPAFEYRWNVQDSVKTKDAFGSRTIQSTATEWTHLYFTQDALSSRVAYSHIDQPTVTATVADGLGVTLDGSVFSAPTASHTTSTWVVFDKTSGVPVYTTTSDVDVVSHNVPLGKLSPNKTYQAMVRYSDAMSSPSVAAHSEWSDLAEFTLQDTFYDDTQLVSDVSSIGTDVGNLQTAVTDLGTDKRDLDDFEYPHLTTTTSLDVTQAKAFTVDRTVSPTLTMTSSATTDIYWEVFVYVVGTTGTVTWPAMMEWDGGSVPVDADLGTNWTVVSIKNFNSVKVAKIESKG